MAEGLIVSFEWMPVFMAFKSEQEGRQIWEDREHVRIIPIGDNKTVEVHEATQKDRERYPEEYERFKRNEHHVVIGTPLQEWPYMGPAQIKMLNHLNIFSVEDLAQLNDTSIQRIGPGGREIVRQAQAYLAKAKDSGVTQHLAAENERMKEELAALKEQMAKLVSDAPEGEPRRKGKVERVSEAPGP